MRKYKAVIYDIDGTILNTLDMNMIPLIKIIKEETGEEWSYEDVLKFTSYPGMKVMEELAFENKEQVYARWVQYVNEYEEGATVYKGFEEVFESFDRNHILQAVVSAKTTQQYDIDMREKDLDRFMKVAVLAEHTDKHKPHPAPLLKCLDHLQLSANDVIYIGDTLSDYEAAKSAGIDFGYATWGSVSNEGILEPEYIFNEPKDLLQLV